MSEADGLNQGGPAGVPPPLAIAIVICDAIHGDPASGKVSILGSYSAIKSNRFPFQIPSVTVFMTLTDGRGTYPCELRFVKTAANLDDDTIIAAARMEMNFTDPLAIFEFGMQFGNLPIMEPGEYRFQLYASGMFVAERRLIVLDVRPKEQP